MDRTKVDSFQKFLDTVSVVDENEIVLFRGQPSNDPLLPKIARQDPSVDTSKHEQEMLDEFKRRASTYLPSNLDNVWDILVFAQHYRMVTRLLDWTSNPLAALWFSCMDEGNISDSFVYIFFVSDEFLLDKQNEKSPFTRSTTRVFKPNLNNPRIIAQDGWFTVHRYAHRNKKFVPLEKNTQLKRNIIEVRIPGQLKRELNNNLNVFGVNYQKIFPDVEGICKHVNWQYKNLRLHNISFQAKET